MAAQQRLPPRWPWQWIWRRRVVPQGQPEGRRQGRIQGQQRRHRGPPGTAAPQWHGPGRQPAAPGRRCQIRDAWIRAAQEAGRHWAGKVAASPVPRPRAIWRGPLRTPVPASPAAPRRQRARRHAPPWRVRRRTVAAPPIPACQASCARGPPPGQCARRHGRRRECPGRAPPAVVRAVAPPRQRWRDYSRKAGRGAGRQEGREARSKAGQPAISASRAGCQRPGS